MNTAAESVRLGELVELVLGKCCPCQDGSGDPREVPFVRVGEFGEVRPAVRRWTTAPFRKARRGDVLLGIAGSTSGRINLSEDCAIGRSVAALRPNASKLDQLYLFYFLKAAVERLRSGAPRHALTLITKKTLQRIEIPLVPLAEQRRIAAGLQEASAGIATARENAQRNLRNAEALFTRRLECVFTHRGIGWMEAPLRELCTVTHGLALPRKDFSASGDPTRPIVLTVGNFTGNGKLAFDGKNTKRMICGEVPPRYRLNAGDLVIVMTDLSPKMKMLGTPASVEVDGLLHNQRIGRFIFLNGRVHPRLVYYFLMSESFLRDIKAAATGKTARHTSPSRILSNLISYPLDDKGQLSLVDQLDAFHAEVNHLNLIYQGKLASLEKLKKSLLSRAFAWEDRTALG